MDAEVVGPSGYVSQNLMSGERIRYVGRIHWSIYLPGIVFAPFVDRMVSRERLVLVGQDVAIGSQAATNVALVLHELATNSAKYGALSSAHGVVHVQCSVKGDALLLTWAEHGGPPIGEAPVVGGFGDMLIHGIVHDTFGGHVTRDWRRDGLTVRLSVPMHILQS